MRRLRRIALVTAWPAGTALALTLNWRAGALWWALYPGVAGTICYLRAGRRAAA